MTDVVKSATSRIGIPLVGKRRVVAGAGGVAGLGSGGAAVFLTENEAGSVALLTVGVLFAFFALAGLLPTRLKLGDNEIEWQQLADVVGEAVVESPPERRAELLQRLVALSATNPGFASRSIAGVAAGDALIELVRAAAPPGVEVLATPWHPEFPVPFDALLVDRERDIRVGVEVKAYSHPLPAGVVRGVIRMAEGARTATTRPRVDRTLLVTQTELTRTARALAEEEGLEVVQVAGPEDALRLGVVLGRLFEQPS